VFENTDPAFFQSLDNWVAIWTTLATLAVRKAAEGLATAENPAEAWATSEQVNLLEATMIHFYRQSTFYFNQQVKTSAARQHLEKLGILFCCHHFAQYSGLAFDLGMFPDPQAIRHIKTALYASLKAVREIAIPLVDGYDFDDAELHTALGTWDG
jgi:hypothetical protein